MPPYDQCHTQIVRALEKAGWQVAPQSPRFSHEDRIVIIDIEARKPSNGLENPIILVEVKCFSDTQAATTAFYLAIGQYIVYRALLGELENNTPLYLAVPQQTFETIHDSTVERVIRDNDVQMIIVDTDHEVITRWINQSP